MKEVRSKVKKVKEGGVNWGGVGTKSKVTYLFIVACRSDEHSLVTKKSYISSLDSISQIRIAIFKFTIMVTILISSSMAVASPPIPPGFSSEIVQVKFKEGTNVDSPDLLLPPDLRNSMVSITPLFSLPKPKMDEIMARGKKRSAKKMPNLNLWFKITLKPSTNAADFIEKLKRLDHVEIAEPAPLPLPPPTTTPDFTGNQGYLGPATDGIDAIFSATIPGGNGSGVKIYDIEYSWNQTHEDLSKANGVPLLLNAGDSAVDPFSDNNHGTAVLGELIADNDSKGVTGISWGADIGLAPANTANLGYNPANAILLAVADGSPGDVILIEQQFPVCNLANFGPSEWLQSVFDAIQAAVANGFVVVEAAGNGNVDLDQPACGTTFDRTVRDSGAIIVGAGNPPSSGLDRQRESFSTYGSRVDLQGWGSAVATTGYGDLYVNLDDPANPNFWYTGFFNGTSSASPIVAGAAADIEGIALNEFVTPLSPFQIRQLLVETGSPQLGDTTEHIGPRPNLREAIAKIINNPPDCSHAKPSMTTLWPPHHQFVSINILGVTDPDEDPINITINSIHQDEQTTGTGSGDTCPDAKGVGTSTAQLSAERSGNGDGRVYHISFTADDGKGGTCTGEVTVCVPHDQGKGNTCVDEGPGFDSTVCK